MQTTLSDRYELGERIAAGAMGSVYEARDTRLGRPVAVKLLKDHLADDATFIERFRREARAAAALTHPNIAHVFDFGIDGRHHYLVMELVEGRDLAQVLREDGPIEPARAADISAKIAGALAHAHEGGVIHRDVKPANVILGPDDRVKVTDFGIARAAGESTLTATGSVMGTAQYISPEQASGRPAGPTSDIYSLGIVLFEMLTGAVPFTGESALSIAMRHINDEVPRPSSLQPAVPEELDAVVAKACAKDPTVRFASATELASATRAAGTGGASTAPVGVAETQRLGAPAQTTAELSTPSTKVWPIPGDRYNPTRIGRAVIAAFLLLVVIAAGLLLWRLSEDEPPARTRAEQPQTQPQASEGSDAIGDTVDISEEIVGLPHEPIVEKLQAEGFDVVVESVASELDEGLVADTNPPPGTDGVTQDTPITLFVSSGPESDEDDEGPGRAPKGKAKGHSKDDD